MKPIRRIEEIVCKGEKYLNKDSIVLVMETNVDPDLELWVRRLDSEDLLEPIFLKDIRAGANIAVGAVLMRKLKSGKFMRIS